MPWSAREGRMSQAIVDGVMYSYNTTGLNNLFNSLINAMHDLNCIAFNRKNNKQTISNLP